MKRHLGTMVRPRPSDPVVPEAVVELKELEAAAAAAVSFLPQRNPQAREQAHSAVGGKLLWASPPPASLQLLVHFPVPKASWA
jgi:hypothetical protein